MSLIVTVYHRHGDGGADCRTCRVLHEQRQSGLHVCVQPSQTAGPAHLRGKLFTKCPCRVNRRGVECIRPIWTLNTWTHMS